MNALQKLRQLTDVINNSKDGLAIVDAWALVERLALRMPVDLELADRVFKEKDAIGLDRLVNALENPQTKAEPDALEVSQHDMTEAMRMFRKRLKFARLDDESRIGGRHLTGGLRSEIDAMEAPRDYPPRVWRALVKAGRLVDTGHGFYALPPQKPS